MENTTDTANKKNTIFLVDDDNFLLNMYSIKFKAAGFDINTAIEGASALAKLREGFSPDVMLIDMVMPNMDGLETLAAIRKENLAVHAKIIILSNQSQPSEIERAKELKVDGYIVKATTIPSEVVTEIQKILGQK